MTYVGEIGEHIFDLMILISDKYDIPLIELLNLERSLIQACIDKVNEKEKPDKKRRKLNASNKGKKEEMKEKESDSPAVPFIQIPTNDNVRSIDS